MNRAPIVTALMCSLVLSGCASTADSVSATYASPLVYENYNCDQLAAEGARLSAYAVTLTGAQDKKATEDKVKVGVGVILFWPSLFFIKGDSQTAADLGQVRGQMMALEQAVIAKKCGIQFDKAQ